MDLSAHAGEFLDRVRLQHDTFIIERRGTPMAALVPIERLRQMRESAARAVAAHVTGSRPSSWSKSGVSLEAGRSRVHRGREALPEPARAEVGHGLAHRPRLDGLGAGRGRAAGSATWALRRDPRPGARTSNWSWWPPATSAPRCSACSPRSPISGGSWPRPSIPRPGSTSPWPPAPSWSRSPVRRSCTSTPRTTPSSGWRRPGAHHISSHGRRRLLDLKHYRFTQIVTPPAFLRAWRNPSAHQPLAGVEGAAARVRCPRVRTGGPPERYPPPRRARPSGWPRAPSRWSASGSSSKPGSSQTQRCRSVKRTVSGATPACRSAQLDGDVADVAPLHAALLPRQLAIRFPGIRATTSASPTRAWQASRLCAVEPHRLVELVVLALGRRRERGQPALHPDVAGDAGADAAAVVGQLHAGRLGGVEQRGAGAAPRRSRRPAGRSRGARSVLLVAVRAAWCAARRRTRRPGGRPWPSGRACPCAARRRPWWRRRPSRSRP